MWTIEAKIATAIEGIFEWAYLESFDNEAEARQALADHNSGETEDGWFRLMPTKLTYDEMYNAAYCEPCSEQMSRGAYEWADAEYLDRLQTYTINGFKDMITAQNSTPKKLRRFGFSKWTCGCCEKAFMGR